MQSGSETVRSDLTVKHHASAPRVVSQRAASNFPGGDQFGLFVLASAGMFLLAPKFVVSAYVLMSGWLTDNAAQPDLSILPEVPLILPIGVTLALLTFRLERITRISALVIAFSLTLAWTYAPLDPRFAALLAAFALTAYGIIRLRLPRFPVALLMTAFVVASLLAAVRWWSETPAVAVLGGFPVLVPMLWYSVYEHGSRTVLSLRRFLLYIAGRLFSSPVVTYRDLFTPAEGRELTATRWAGVRTLYIALLASIAMRLASALLALPAIESFTGLSLLMISYLDYVGYCFGIVVRFNTFIGVLRLFGVPVRSNFRYWLLARTPNEHWQRWNILAREWFLTFVFYPIMRARRWLFAAVMSALLSAGVLHAIPVMLINGFHAPHAAAHLVYWTVNGLAIYLVIKLPLLYPDLAGRLRMRDSRAWSVAGIVLTSAFYAVLHGLRSASGSWAEMGDYIGRLLGGLPV